MIYLAQFIEKNNKIYISGVRSLHDNEVYDVNLFIRLSEEVYLFLKEKLNLDEGRLSKYYINNIVSEINDVSSIQVDDSVNYTNDMNYLVEHYSTIARELVFSRIKFLPIKLFEYISINNELISKGYFISDENKEEKYLEILNKESEEFIEKFIKYLEIVDKLSLEKEIVRKYDEFIENIQSVQTKEEIENLYLVFSAEYY